MSRVNFPIVLMWERYLQSSQIDDSCLESAVEYLSIPFMIAVPNYDNLISGKLMRAIVFLS